VDSSQQLFRFNTATPANVTNIGAPLGFLPEGIDFRPSSNILYAIDVGPNTTQLYTIDISTAVATAVGDGFPSADVGYDLTGNQTFGFDFNPTTLQMSDGSMRIRLVSTGNENLRLHSGTGEIAVVDTDLLIVGGASPFVDAIAYTNNIANFNTISTELFDMDSRNDELFEQDPPNMGTLTPVGAFGVTIDGERNIGFDIGTNPFTMANSAFAVYERLNAPIGNEGEYLIYNVNLATGATTGGALVGTAPNFYDFDGGFSVLFVPEPTSLLLMVVGLAGAAILRRRPC
jgi:hypothetical protein